VKFYSLLLGLSYRRQRTHFWSSFLKKLIPVLILVFLIDMNARHFREMVGRLNDWWSVTRTQMEMGEIAAALDASTRRPRSTGAGRVPGLRAAGPPRVPPRPLRPLEPAPALPRRSVTTRSVLRTDRTCGTADDVRRLAAGDAPDLEP
jgi:hypothetical protein